MHISHHVNLQPYHTFGIEVYTKAFTIIKEKSELYELKSLKEKYSQLLILGGGSNVLFTKDFDGIIVLNQLQGIEILDEDNEHVTLRVASGIHWHEFVLYAVQHNWGGIENLSFIPGTVGAAPIQNIGAYGVEVKNVILEVHAFDLENEKWVSFSNQECRFGYRDSIFKLPEKKGKYLITDVVFRLIKSPKHFEISYGDIQKTLNILDKKELNVKNISDAVIFIRNQKLPNPKILGNAGSFFKNPEISIEKARELSETYPSMPQYPFTEHTVKIPAAWLIEQCGWKGKKIGNTGNHTQQALVIVNYGNATGEEIRQHALNVQKSVWEKFGIRLSPEVNFIPIVNTK